MTNFDKWRSYTSSLPTPDNMLDWCWLYTVASALERRVWIGPEHEQLFPNMYVCMVSEPGIGKSFGLKYASSLLRKWYRGDNAKLINEIFSDPSHKVIAEMSVEQDKKAAEESQLKEKNQSEVVKPYLIKMTAEASSYQALIVAFGRAVGRINYIKLDKEGKPGIGLYIHSTLCALLEEFATLLSKKSNETVTFLLRAYDSPLDFDYETISRGRDRIRKGCLNILACANPQFMQECLDERLISEALLSRIFFIYANKDRFPVSRIPKLTPEQEQHKEDIENHILKLTTLYGQVTMSEETWAFIHEWWCDVKGNDKKKASNNPALKPYYARKVIHMQKVAMAKHFSESYEKELSLETVKWAIDFLHKEEKSMHLALTLEGNDIGAKMVKEILKILSDGELTFVDLYMKLYQILRVVDKKKLEEALDFLQETKQIRNEQRPDIHTQAAVVWWVLC